MTYSLHIILRFELERELLTGTSRPPTSPRRSTRSPRVPRLAAEGPRNGVLQDVHWSGMSFGYFPTYALGNVISIQLWERADSEVGDLKASSSPASSGRCGVAR